VTRRFLNRRWWIFFLIQMNGSAVSLYAAMKASMCCRNCSTAVKEAPLSDWPSRIVIGPAVNLTARIESLCRDLDRSLLLSADFVRTSGVSADPLGEFALKDVGENQL